MAEDDRVGRALRDIVQLLSRERVKYCLIGAVAVGAWGQPRMTQDVDVLAVLEDTSRHRVMERLEERGFEIDQQWAQHNPMIREWQIRLQKGGVPVDLLLARDDHDLEALGRRRRKKLNDLWLFVLSPEDLILSKLKVGRPRDFEDALSVIVRQKNRLNVPYLQEWAKRLHITAELAYLMRR